MLLYSGKGRLARPNSLATFPSQVHAANNGHTQFVRVIRQVLRNCGRHRACVYRRVVPVGGITCSCWGNAGLATFTRTVTVYPLKKASAQSGDNVPPPLVTRCKARPASQSGPE